MTCRKRRPAPAIMGALALGLMAISAMAVAATGAGTASASAAATAAAPALASAAPAALTAGAATFQQKCAVCHTPEAHGHGLSLKGIVGRQAGSVASFGYYSPGMKAAGFRWDAERLSAFLADPGKYIPGSSMKASVPDDAERAALVDYLTQHP